MAVRRDQAQPTTSPKLATVLGAQAIEVATAVDQPAGGVVSALADFTQRADGMSQLAGGVVHMPGTLAVGIDAPAQAATRVVAILRGEVARAGRAGTEDRAGRGDLLRRAVPGCRIRTA